MATEQDQAARDAIAHNEHLQHLARLQTTDKVAPLLVAAQERLDKAILAAATSTDTWVKRGVSDAEANLRHYDDLMEQCTQRDELQATRPEQCWCLGVGGSGISWIRAAWGESHRVLEKLCSYCPEGIAEYTRISNLHFQEQANMTLKRQEAHWDNAEIPARFSDLRLETHPLAKSNPVLIKRLSRPEEPRDPDSGPSDDWADSWYLYGAYGTGKTGLAVGHAWERVQDNEYTSVLFRRMPDLLSELRSTYNRPRGDEGPSENDLIEKYTEVGLLILDDLGAEQVSGSGWVEDRLYQIIGKRHDEMMPTVFTSNLSIEELAKRIGERVTWRIVEMCGKDHIVEVKGANLRRA